MAPRLVVVYAFILTVNCDVLVEVVNERGLREDLTRHMSPHTKVRPERCTVTDNDAIAPAGYCLAKGTSSDVAALRRGLGMSRRTVLTFRDPEPLFNGCRTLRPFSTPAAVHTYVTAHPTGWGDLDYILLTVHPPSGSWCLEVRYAWS